ncbi:MAG: threonylcarbamoyl-AMP synthase [Sphingobacteriales bacterium]|nr:MAG: threonylcarbamoyl-AMP synthase [Sphingobacteriales bacterium]
MLQKIHPENPSPRQISAVVEVLQKDGIIVYPTDTLYALGCDMKSTRAIERLCRLIGKKPEEANLSLICHDLSNLSEYTVPFDNRIYKMMRKCFPGPYTFILKANHRVPKLFKNKKKTIGIRVPDNNIPRQIVELLGNPIVTASLRDITTHEENLTNPELIYEMYEKHVDLVIDGGDGELEPSTVIDCSNDEIVLVRQGKGETDFLSL